MSRFFDKNLDSLNVSGICSLTALILGSVLSTSDFTLIYCLSHEMEFYKNYLIRANEPSFVRLSS